MYVHGQEDKICMCSLLNPLSRHLPYYSTQYIRESARASEREREGEGERKREKERGRERERERRKGGVEREGAETYGIKCMQVKVVPWVRCGRILAFAAGYMC